MNNYRNYILLDSVIPFRREIAYIDTEDCLANKVFGDHGIKIKFLHDFTCNDSDYMVVFASFWKKDCEKVLEALDDLKNKMLLLGKRNYEEFCTDFTAKHGW